MKGAMVAVELIEDLDQAVEFVTDCLDYDSVEEFEAACHITINDLVGSYTDLDVAGEPKGKLRVIDSEGKYYLLMGVLLRCYSCCGKVYKDADGVLWMREEDVH